MTQRRAFLKLVVGGVAGAALPVVMKAAPLAQEAAADPLAKAPADAAYRLGIFDFSDTELFAAYLPHEALRFRADAISIGDYVQFSDVVRDCHAVSWELRTAGGELIRRNRFDRVYRLLPGDTLNVSAKFVLNWT